ncbi:MAG: hypothetical protein Unbinned3065contig1007_16 [Prokaryotic dsDNA virus sp.]|nr:MAG: hypothetical protein Unbinned3065contig1007_16 [Prokaryotic dsDNA virus sp.]|tara:strand:- start:10329 stop:10685 length:357 start_codon:yes stop_codon:yes gene_type:complete
MHTPIYASQEHQTLIEVYINTCKDFCKDVSSKSRYNNYLDVIETIIEYHNNYGSGVKENNYYDWLMIIPINLSVATNGYFAALETKRNASVIRSYKVILEQMLVDVVTKIDDFEIKND